MQTGNKGWWSEWLEWRGTMNVTCFASHARGSCSGSNPEKVVLCNATAGVNFGALFAKTAFPAPKSKFWAQKCAFAPKVGDICYFCNFVLEDALWRRMTSRIIKIPVARAMFSLVAPDDARKFIPRIFLFFLPQVAFSWTLSWILVKIW